MVDPGTLRHTCEYHLWRKPNGIRQALLDNYREAGRIPAAQAPLAVKNWAGESRLFGEITILEPKASSTER